ncbi:protein bfr2-like [Hibiscus syriacus]|uniref:protein bfr2-like n=1 Tax=Hibiscus syriacus TaxID=106335 RepID=UPI00192306CA|nr:protein bfr2-like [Hibiscus syriacus]
MFRVSPSRNQRSKGLKVKHALQICVLLGICIWLLYQVKHSGEKKAAYGHQGMKSLSWGERTFLDRKEYNEGDNEKPEEETERRQDSLDGWKEEDSEESKENGNSGSQEDTENKGNEEAHEEKETEKSEGEIENSGASDDRVRDGVDQNNEEAREEHYKADDASSEVVHVVQNVAVENETSGS